MLLPAILFLIGLLLSGFFSGTETGMYRVSRIRMVLDALAGSWLSRGMVWLLNHPTLFVATALVGNNLANYLVSLGIVMLVPLLIHGSGVTTELLGTILTTPIVFVLGELLPKYLFYHASYRLLHATRPLLLIATVVFAPISLILGILGNMLRLITGETPIRLRLSMQRAELEQILRHGHEAGVLAGGQRRLAKNIFEIGNQPAIRFGVALDRLAVTPDPVSLEAAKKEAHRKGQSIVLVQRRKKIIGFLRFARLQLDNQIMVEPIVRCGQDESHLAVLYKLYDSGTHIAALVDAAGRTQGIVTRHQLLRSFLSSQSPML